MIQYSELGDILIEIVPEIRSEYEKLMTEWGDQHPGQHIVFGDILFPHIVALLGSIEKSEALKNIFNFLEDLANQDDKLIQEVVAFSIIECLIDDEDILTQAWMFMGPTTRRFAHEVSEYWGTSQSFPFAPD